jgi:Fe-Mn family superoxide dismutase
MSIQLPNLPYALSALEPHVSRETLDVHYNKHHRGYVEKLGELIATTNHAHATLDDIVRSSSGPIFDNAAQVWNHNFYWQSLSPEPTQVHGELAARIDRDFGSFNQFREAFTKAAKEHFGSGWAWLVEERRGTLAVITTHDAETPLESDTFKPLLTCDVWEHAYYIDHRNDRGAYLDAFWHVANWDFAARRLKA